MSSYFSYVIPSISYNGSKTSREQNDRKQIQTFSVRYNNINQEPQDDPSDEYVDCSPVCKSSDILKDKINDEDQVPPRCSNSSEVFEEANLPQTPNSAKKPPVNITDDSNFISPELYEFFESCLPNIVKGCRWVLLYR